MGVHRDQSGSKFAFVFSRPVAYPPNIHDMKCYYLSRELISRGERVTWIQLGRGERADARDGIDFVNIPISPTNQLFTAFSVMRMVLFCVAKRIRVVHMDEWLFFRHRPFWTFMGVIGLRATGVKVGFDERDPLVDFEVATGELKANSRRYATTQRAHRLSERMANLLVLTSQAYEELYISEGFKPGKVFGGFRGIDTAVFTPQADGEEVRARLGLEGKFVIGWFGLMHPFRQIREILIPLARELDEVIPNSHLLIGGNGPLYPEFQELAKEDNRSLTLLGLVPYQELPRHIAACDVLLCPVDPRYRFTQNSCWLKITEALAVGRPVIATKTKISDLDYKDLKGVVWVDSSLESFTRALERVQNDYPNFLAMAQDQAWHFDNYSVRYTISKMTDRIEGLASRRVQ